jgi:hypothetical protein
MQQAIKYERPVAGSIRAEPANFEECESIACGHKVKANLLSYPSISAGFNLTCAYTKKGWEKNMVGRIK